VETHILDTDRDVYGKSMGLDFCFRLRGEKKFSGVEALSQQIRIDVEQARTYLGRLKKLGRGGN
jgi:riboflavin kinase/FMN adenylyltransferase